LNPKRFLPFGIGLIVLAFALGSLPRSSAGGSLLFRSWWLLYLIYLGPFLALGIMIALIVIVAMNWRDFAGSLGFKMARNRKRKRSYVVLIWLFVWTLAIVVVVNTPGTIFNPKRTNSTLAANIQGSSAPLPNPFQLEGIFPSISNLVQSNWFSAAFLGLLILGGLVIVESVRVSLKETSEMNIQELRTRQIEGLQATQDAIRMLDDKETDPRTKIITCFQCMVTAVSRFGVPVSSNQTARELERAIRLTFALKGDATIELTDLFEEARYSLHDISHEDAERARQSLVSIGEELKIHLDS
jgi:hypothetical protein